MRYKAFPSRWKKGEIVALIGSEWRWKVHHSAHHLWSGARKKRVNSVPGNRIDQDEAP